MVRYGRHLSHACSSSTSASCSCSCACSMERRPRDASATLLRPCHCLSSRCNAPRYPGPHLPRAPGRHADVAGAACVPKTLRLCWLWGPAPDPHRVATVRLHIAVCGFPASCVPNTCLTTIELHGRELPQRAAYSSLTCPGSATTEVPSRNASTGGWQQRAAAAEMSPRLRCTLLTLMPHLERCCPLRLGPHLSRDNPRCSLCGHLRPSHCHLQLSKVDPVTP